MTRLWPEEAERSVLGCILSAASYSADAGHRVLRRVVAAGLDPEHFYLAAHGELYAALIQMADASVPIDPVSVAAWIDEHHEDPRLIGRLRLLALEVPAIGTSDRYARIVVDAAIRREIEGRPVA